jgi:putative DNA primase/helicase
VLGELLGKRNLTAATLQALSENRFAAADVYGKLANICADISSHELRMTGIFKQLTGGDVIRAEKKHRDAFEFTNVAKLSFSANEIPATRDASSAFFDRWIVLRFPTRFRGTSAEHKNLGRQIAANPAEMSGVLNRALRGLTRLRRTGHFTVGRAMRDAQAEFRREADTVALFLEDQVPSERSARFEQGRTFYEQYRAWCDANGHQALSSHRLYRRLRDWSPTDELAVRHTKSQGSSYFTIDRQGS